MLFLNQHRTGRSYMIHIPGPRRFCPCNSRLDISVLEGIGGSAEVRGIGMHEGWEAASGVTSSNEA
jgi:hypothetical protein